MLRVRVLGSAAGGGVPQWNCNCEVCALARANNGAVLPRTQSSIAVSGDGTHWVIFNCSPDIRQQITDTTDLWPTDGQRRHTPISSVVLTNADIDHISGLLILREKQPFTVYATGAVLDVLASNSVFNVLDSELVERRELPAQEALNIGADVVVEAFSVPGKVALFNEEDMLEKSNSLNIGEETEHTIGLKISSTSGGESFYYIPGCAMMTEALANRLMGASLVFFDGTVWINEEMISQNLGAKSGARMGHMSMSGPNGSIEAFAGLGIKRKVFIHINNSNRVLIENSSEREEAVRAGWEIAYDQMEITL